MRGKILMLALAGSVIGAADARAGVFLCVPSAAGVPVTSGGSSGACGSSTPVELPESRTDQQTLMSVLPHMSYRADGIGGKPTITFKGANVQLINGAGSTLSKNGTGNLVLGYNEGAGEQSGSHSVLVGDGHTLRGSAALVSGRSHTANGDFGTLLGGSGSTVNGYGAVAGGGWYQTAGTYATALGGRGNKATEHFGLALGGESNTARGSAAVTVGGRDNVAAGNSSTVAGGCANLAGAGTLASYDGCPSDSASYWAVGDAASVFGGKFNHAAATLTAISGGERNKASGRLSSVAGGKQRGADRPGASVEGSEYWVRTNSAGQKVADSGSINGQSIDSFGSSGSGWKYVKFPGIELSKCKVTALGVGDWYSGQEVRTSTYIGGDWVYVWVTRQKWSSGSLSYVDEPNAEAQVTVNCNG